MLLEEFDPKVEHVQEVKNVVAETLSHLDIEAKPYDSINDTHKTMELSDVKDIFEELFPMSPKEIRSHQQKDEKLLQCLEKDHKLSAKMLEGKK